MNNKNLSLELNRSKIISTLIYATIVLLILNCTSIYIHYKLGFNYAKGFVPQFDFDVENNIPTYFSSMLLLISAVLMYWLSISAKQAHQAYARHWLALSIIFSLMSLDEIASLHELLIYPLQDGFNLSGIFYWSWVIVGSVFVVIIAAAYFKFLVSLPPSTRNGIILAAALYTGGAIGMEMIGGYYYSIHLQDFIAAVLTTIEETLEISGSIFLINVLFNYIFIESPSLELKIKS